MSLSDRERAGAFEDTFTVSSTAVRGGRGFRAGFSVVSKPHHWSNRPPRQRQGNYADSPATHLSEKDVPHSQ